MFRNIGLVFCRASSRVNGLANLRPVVVVESSSCRGIKGFTYLWGVSDFGTVVGIGGGVSK